MWNDLFNVFHSSASNFDYLQVQLIEKVSVQNDDDIDKVLWEREKYWLAQLFTLSYGLNNAMLWTEEVVGNNIFLLIYYFR